MGKPFHTIALRINPQLLENPDADVRYLLPDLIVERSGDTVTEDGYDYVGTEPFLVVYFKTIELQSALACILDVVKNECVLGNNLKDYTVVAVDQGGSHDVVYPKSFVGPFFPN